ncbi:MAG: hypothetical protein ACI4S1_16135 [Roseburia sp.]|nr:hypothetical protein [Lachnospiraceae bacterium]
MSKKRSGLRMSDLQQNRHLLLKMPVSVGAKHLRMTAKQQRS